MTLKALFLVSALLLLQPVAAQTRFGVVWDPPNDPLEIEADLTAIRSMGFSAVRTGLLDDDLVLGLADSLGITVYQELFSPLQTGPEIAAAVPELRDRLGRALAVSDGHPSAAWFGLAYAPATNQARTCQAIRTLVDYARPRASPDVGFYYVSWLPESDACTSNADLVLLDDAMHDRPMALLSRWRAAVPVGLAAVGRVVDPDGPQGLSNDRSEERQAAFLADAIPALRDSRAEVVFLYRWRDPVQPQVFHPAPLEGVFGLQDETGRARPARDVAERALTLGQTVFALRDGVRAAAGTSWFLLAGLLVLLSVTVMLAVSARFRAMAPRYFVAHGFYRNAIHDGRDTPGFVAAGMLALLGVVMGLLAWLPLRILASEPILHALWYRSEPDLQAAIDGIVNNPVLFSGLAGSVGLVATVFWLSAWSVAANRKSRLSAAQALLLAVFPRWPMLVLLLASMLLVANWPANARYWVEILLAAWFVSALWGTARGSADLARVARTNPIVTLIYWLLSPVVVLVLIGMLFKTLQPNEAAFYTALLGR